MAFSIDTGNSLIIIERKAVELRKRIVCKYPSINREFLSHFNVSQVVWELFNNSLFTKCLAA